MVTRTFDFIRVITILMINLEYEKSFNKDRNNLYNFISIFIFILIKVMCVQYWPAGKNKEEVYAGVGVTVENEEQIANFMIRTIRLRKVTSFYLILPFSVKKNVLNEQ